jgi:hypothetical protein
MWAFGSLDTRNRKEDMKRASRVVLAVLLLVAAGSAPDGRLLAAQQPPPQEPPPPKPPDPLEEFVPHEKVEADSIVSFPVDI